MESIKGWYVVYADGCDWEAVKINERGQIADQVTAAEINSLTAGFGYGWLHDLVVACDAGRVPAMDAISAERILAAMGCADCDAVVYRIRG